jgi:hypothetical protein
MKSRFFGSSIIKIILIICIILLLYRTIYHKKESFLTDPNVTRKTDCIRDAMFYGNKRCNSKYPSVEADYQSLRVDDFFNKKVKEEPININSCTSKSCPYLPTGSWIPQITRD